MSKYQEMRENLMKGCWTRSDTLAIINDLEKAESQSSWTRYIEGEPDTYPKVDGDLYEILYLNELLPQSIKTAAHEHYYFSDGWATDKTVLYYREVPPILSEVNND
jgi:hypothetical protein